MYAQIMLKVGHKQATGSTRAIRSPIPAQWRCKDQDVVAGVAFQMAQIKTGRGRHDLDQYQQRPA
jgi:hypothetical protein